MPGRATNILLSSLGNYGVLFELFTMVLFVFLRSKMSVVYRPHLQTSVEEEVDQTSAVCKKKTVCFLTCVDF
ncbi:hypothetical protein HanRHA438_Chr17g0827301 [Helianthus annuus]|nr:hypothetical protein HanRHA438_Chr17g0827301 [Helianthus annuus]